MMIRHILTLVLSFPAVASAQTTDPQTTDLQQKKDWFYLQTLATQAAVIDTCITIEMADSGNGQRNWYVGTPAWKTDWDRYYALTDEVSAEVEKYVKTHPARDPQESIGNLRFKVWSVVFSAYKKKEHSLLSDTTLSKAECVLLPSKAPR
jgi:hypothetical protein